MSDAKDQTLSLSIRLKPVSPLRTRTRRTLRTSAWPKWIVNVFAINVTILLGSSLVITHSHWLSTSRQTTRSPRRLIVAVESHGLTSVASSVDR